MSWGHRYKWGDGSDGRCTQLQNLLQTDLKLDDLERIREEVGFGDGLASKNTVTFDIFSPFAGNISVLSVSALVQTADKGNNFWNF